jgi:hypothetical protein
LNNLLDDVPGEIATERPDKHCTDVRLACAAHTQRTGKWEHHDYPAQHPEDAVDWVECPPESHSGKHGDLAKGGMPRGDCGADGNENVLPSDLIAQSRPFQHGLKESLRARDTEPDVAFTKFRDEKPQFVCRRRIDSPRGLSVVKKESERIWSSADERARGW